MPPDAARHERTTTRTGSGGIAARGRPVLARTPIIVGARAMFLLGITTAPGFTLGHGRATARAGLVTRDAVAGRELDFQLDDFIPLFIAAVALRDRQEFAQATPAIVG
ncbi:MAG: hypothetical protein FWF20_09530, partial [Betaproteobacteria bacterium]|nr:hypothetical protein [Betaproteobacteria bacterium]